MFPISRAPIASKISGLRLLKPLGLKAVRFGLKAYAAVFLFLMAVTWIYLDAPAPYNDFAQTFVIIVIPFAGPISLLMTGISFPFGINIGEVAFVSLVFLVASGSTLPLLILPFVKRRSWLAKLGFCIGILAWLFWGLLSNTFFWSARL